MSIRQHDFTIERRPPDLGAGVPRFADPELKRRWFGVPEGWTDTRWELDFVGGSELSVDAIRAGRCTSSAAGTTTSSTVSGSSSPTTSCSTGGSSPYR